jgi:diguanylate cyclase (GGDEF)-like protein
MGCDAVGFVHHPISEFLDAKYQINQAFLERIRGGNASNEYEIILINLDNRTVEALASANAITYDNRRSVVIGITDITEIKKAQQTLRYYATFDEMTGLVNRRTGLIMLESEMERARRDGRPLAVCFGDLDGLKSTNDLLGHREGDRLIRALAEALLASVRGGDVAVRLGGDEFLLILHECTESQAHLLIDRVQEKLTQIASRECLSALSASFGVVAFDPACHTKPEALVELADDRMYRVKNAKRGAASAVLVEA